MAYCRYLIHSYIHTYDYTYILVFFSICDDDADRRHGACAVLFHGRPHAVLQQLQQHVRYVAGNIREVQVCATVDGYLSKYYKILRGSFHNQSAMYWGQ